MGLAPTREVEPVLSIVLAAQVVLESSQQAAAAPGWPSWGGPRGDFRIEGSCKLADEFGAQGPRVVWKRELGDGYSAIVAAGDRLFTQYRDGDDEIVVALAASDGRTLWQDRAPARRYEDMDESFGRGPNATPALVEDHVVAIGIAGNLRCLELDSGKLAWSLDLHERYGRQKRREEYGFSASPIVHDGQLIVLVGGEPHGVVALDPFDGTEIWGSPPSRVSYAPASMIEVEGQHQLVFFAPTEVLGLDPGTGDFLWRFPVKCVTENNLTPALLLPDRHLWVASQLDGGTRVLKLPGRGSLEPPRPTWSSRTLTQAHWDSFCIGDYVYGSLGGNSSSFLAAVNWCTGEVAWKHRGFHLAKGVLADGKLYFLDENGQLAIARFSPEGVEILDAHQLLDRECWTPPTLVGTVLYARDRKHVVAVDLAVGPRMGG